MVEPITTEDLLTEAERDGYQDEDPSPAEGEDEVEPYAEATPVAPSEGDEDE